MSNDTTPPTPRRCHRIVEAHHLSCEGRSLRQIAREMGCAHSTVHAYLRDFERFRAYILHTVAADQLVNHVYLLTRSDTEPAQHARHVAAVRELRLLLTTPASCLTDQSEQQPAPLQDNLEEPGTIWIDPEQPSQKLEQSGPSWTNLDKSEHPNEENPVQDASFITAPTNSPPKRPLNSLELQIAASSDGPTGHVPPQDPNSPMIRRLFQSSKWK